MKRYTFLETYGTSGKAERLYQTEGLPHDMSIEQFTKTPQKAYLTMDDSEKNRYIEFLIQQKEERDKTIADKDAFIENLWQSCQGRDVCLLSYLHRRSTSGRLQGKNLSDDGAVSIEVF